MPTRAQQSVRGVETVAVPPPACTTGTKIPAMDIAGGERMRPVAVHGLFGWLHIPPAGAKDVAILICPALNRDGLDSHQAFRVLADMFAAVGYPTMRFNYPATGDSCDLGEIEFAAGEHWMAWQDSVHVVANWLRRATGARRLIFCGLRIGATIAALSAAHRDDLAGLILLAPVLRGRSYLRQVSVEAGLQRGAVSVLDDGLDFEELHFAPETIRLLDQVDLRRVKFSAGQQIAIFAQAQTNPLAACVQAWTLQGANLLCGGFEGLEPLLQHNLEGEGEPTDFSAVLEWVKRSVPAQQAPSGRGSPLPPAILHPAGCTETPVTFGPDNRLFGIWCRPAGAEGEAAVIIGNAGRDPHYGNARFGTEFARQLAASGLASLRIDFSGLGDSIGPAEKENMLGYVLESNRAGDIGAAIDLMEQLGYRSFMVHGICAGAYHAFHAALADARIRTLLLVNMPVFTWSNGKSINLAKRLSLPLRYYLMKLFQFPSWRRLLQGKLDFTGIINAQVAKLHAQLRAAAFTLAAGRFAAAAPETFARQALGALSSNGVKTLFLYHRDNVGLRIFEENFGPGGAALSQFSGAFIAFIPEFERKLRYDQSLRIGGTMMIDFLAQQPSTTGVP